VPADETVNRVLWTIPNVLCLIGSSAGDEVNAMTASWVTQLAMEPVIVGASVDAASVTHRLIEASGAFSVNLWDRADTRVFVKFSKPAVHEAGMLNGRAIRFGTTGVPIFEEALAFIECSVTRTIPLGSHTLFAGEVVDCGFQGDESRQPARIEDTRMHYGGVLRGR
jgi:flavin reductase (DIM6/NTAB) family NADH-FMN oxidoreductase RutF